ncbi:hypothetical protein ABB02_01852 [Clostridiaceae bacterium JG1575]|nr:hypothetical protein ABB02_01852 [Clostridiaceae bacterium JG1575]
MLKEGSGGASGANPFGDEVRKDQGADRWTPKDPKIILETRGISFGNWLYFPDVAIRKGCVVFIRGESGAGKSTFFRLLNNTRNLSSGTIFFEGRDILSLDPLVLRQEVLLLGQNTFLFPGTVKENVAAFRATRGLDPLSEDVLHRFLNLVQLPVKGEDPVDTMSGGERQRLFMAICLAFEPKVLLMDEPTSALDAQTGHRVLEGIIEFAREREMTLLIISHDDGLRETFAQEVITIEKGDR